MIYVEPGYTNIRKGAANRDVIVYFWVPTSHWGPRSARAEVRREFQSDALSWGFELGTIHSELKHRTMACESPTDDKMESGRTVSTLKFCAFASSLIPTASFRLTGGVL